jgi:alpha-glucosidase (family GH31 glycosyl hydrolase)
VARPLYLQYPEQQDAYAEDGSEYLYGPDVLVAPVTTPGTTASTPVWFPPGSSWTDYFTGQTYPGGTTATVSTGLGTMPVFIKSGGIVTTRTGDETNDDQNPLTKVTVTVAGGADGSFGLYEDNGSTTDFHQSAVTRISYGEGGGRHTVRIAAAAGSFRGQVSQRQWTVAFLDASAPASATINGRAAPASAWSWDAGARTLTVTAPAQSVHQALTVSYR